MREGGPALAKLASRCSRSEAIAVGALEPRQGRRRGLAADLGSRRVADCHQVGGLHLGPPHRAPPPSDVAARRILKDERSE